MYDKKLERNIILILAVILIVIGLSGCSYPYAPLDSN